jgi:hypothetical protein
MTSVTRIQREIDLDSLENEISSSLEKMPSLRLPPAPQLPTPDIGKLSADAVLEQFKVAAKSVEAMGAEVQERIRALEAAIVECNADLTLLAEAAEAIRAKGKHAHAEIERTSAVSKDIRNIVDQIKVKLA